MIILIILGFVLVATLSVFGAISIWKQTTSLSSQKEQRVTLDSIEEIIAKRVSELNNEVEENIVQKLLGDNERALHIAGIKEAPIESQKKWRDEKVKTNEVDVDGFINTLSEKKDELQKIAGITGHDRDRGVNEIYQSDTKLKLPYKIALSEDDTTRLLKRKLEASRKQVERDLDEKSKRDFEALPFSRISKDTRAKISELVRLDLSNQMKVIEENTPEIDDIMGTIGSKPKTQTDYQNEHAKSNEMPEEIKAALIKEITNKGLYTKPTEKVMGEYQLNNKEKVRKSLTKNKK